MDAVKKYLKWLYILFGAKWFFALPILFAISKLGLIYSLALVCLIIVAVCGWMIIDTRNDNFDFEKVRLSYALLKGYLKEWWNNKP